MEAVNCKHHPEYDPASGEPTSSLWNNTLNVEMPFPCPCCWQARAKWITDYVNEQSTEIVEQLQPRIAELEGQLAKANEIEKHGTQLIKNLTDWKREAEKREAQLREALEFYGLHSNYHIHGDAFPGGGLLTSIVDKDGGAKARAELEGE